MRTDILIDQGRTAEVYAYGHDRIVKLFRPNLPPQEIEQEFQNGLVINRTGLGPQLFSKTTFHGRTGLVYERIHGPTMLLALLRHPWKIVYYAKQLATLHVQIHQMNGDQLPDQKEQLKRNILRTDLLSQAEKQAIVNDLAHLEPKRCLCHGDFHPENILLTREGPVVIDWMTANSGSPAADVARTVLLLHYGQLREDKPLFQRWATKHFRFLLYKAYKRCYQKATNLSEGEIEQWVLPVAAARLCDGCPVSEKKQLVHLIHNRLEIAAHQGSRNGYCVPLEYEERA